MKSVKYLLQLQDKLAMSDSALARELGITQPAVSMYKNGKRIMDDETCLAVALKLDIDPINIIGAACIDRAEKSGQKSLWEVFMSRSAATAASALLLAGVTNFLTPENAEAAPLTAPFKAAGQTNLYYVKSQMVFSRRYGR
jgi:transcriptional regulator with XRE-family HTH domain